MAKWTRLGKGPGGRGNPLYRRDFDRERTWKTDNCCREAHVSEKDDGIFEKEGKREKKGAPKLTITGGSSAWVSGEKTSGWLRTNTSKRRRADDVRIARRDQD